MGNSRHIQNQLYYCKLVAMAILMAKFKIAFMKNKTKFELLEVMCVNCFYYDM